MAPNHTYPAGSRPPTQHDGEWFFSSQDDDENSYKDVNVIDTSAEYNKEPKQAIMEMILRAEALLSQRYHASL